MINQRRRSQIQAKADELLATRPVEELPVNVRAIAKGLGIAVELADFGEEVSGVLVRTDGASMIGVNWLHHPNRQRFTIAHEIGHYCLHEGGTFIDKGVTARFRDQASGSGTSLEEHEANLFAATLLMPAEMVQKAAELRPFALDDEDALKRFADQFGVSAQAMLIRLQEIGLLEQ
jgi:Zn-dependent peptidase ImmA (M78 family)